MDTEGNPRIKMVFFQLALTKAACSLEADYICSVLLFFFLFFFNAFYFELFQKNVLNCRNSKGQQHRYSEAIFKVLYISHKKRLSSFL